MCRRVSLLVPFLLASAIAALLSTSCVSGQELSDLQVVVSSFEDPQMSSYDLAFYLATHGYDATPTEGYVDLNLNSKTYRLTPNSYNPGLCDIAVC
jgi:hypothetical protein